MYKTKICNFISGLLSFISAIIIFVLVNNGTIAIATLTIPLVIAIAFSALSILSIIYILSHFNLFSNRKESYCLCRDSKTIIFSSIITFLLGLIILIGSTVLGTLSAAILLGIVSGTFVLTILTFICITFCLTNHLCQKECICYNFCSTQDN